MGKKTKKDFIIVIPGPHFLRLHNHHAQKVILSFYERMKINRPIFYNYAKVWSTRLSDKSNHAVWLHWGRGLSAVSRWFAIRRLKKLIRHYKNTHNVKIVGISLGSEIARAALKDFDNGEVSKAVFLCPVMGDSHMKFKNIRIASIYSPEDVFARLSIKAIGPLHGGVILSGENIKNIALNKFYHGEFCEDARIKSGEFKGKRVSELVSSLLK